MIVREDESGFFLFEQDRHAHLSGIISEAWDNRYFTGIDKRTSTGLAITHHDRGWALLDRKILLHHKTKRPLSFIDYPLRKKIAVYKQGVDEIEQVNLYSALLMSLHYTSFFRGKLDIAGCTFREEEQNRQSRLRESLAFTEKDEQALKFHYDLLQFSDNLSLYVCMNEWGAEKEREVPWFSEGFPQRFGVFHNERVKARWKSKTEVLVSPFPFSGTRLTITVPFKYIEKVTFQENDPNRIYRETSFLYHDVTFTEGG
ncbi:DUF3891 family protein [Alteribacter keqinensis]|uniref:DUF3891 family protein n=1 Tax=Alteribacter keqinensis TaxID=2483800 RepID=UPI001605ED1D|nr:DUF3891 family protein [Alteribacter keqinensis]